MLDASIHSLALLYAKKRFLLLLPLLSLCSSIFPECKVNEVTDGSFRIIIVAEAPNVITDFLTLSGAVEQSALLEAKKS